MTSTRTLARRAGWLYLLANVVAPFAYLYVPNQLIVPGDAVATLAHVRAHEALLRAAIGAEIWNATVGAFAVLLLYRLFEGVDKGMSRLMAALFLLGVPVSYANVVNHVAPIVLANNPAYGDQAAPLAMLFLRLHNSGLAVAQVLWGLWLIPLGIVVRRSAFLPGWLAYPLFAAGIGYVAHSLGMLCLPPSLRGVTSFGQVLGVGELPFFLYLLFRGARTVE